MSFVKETRLNRVNISGGMNMKNKVLVGLLVISV